MEFFKILISNPENMVVVNISENIVDLSDRMIKWEVIRKYWR